jgi:hypothetical protein
MSIALGLPQRIQQNLSDGIKSVIRDEQPSSVEHTNGESAPYSARVGFSRQPMPSLSDPHNSIIDHQKIITPKQIHDLL